MMSDGDVGCCGEDEEWCGCGVGVVWVWCGCGVGVGVGVGVGKEEGVVVCAAARLDINVVF